VVMMMMATMGDGSSPPESSNSASPLSV
jgi:hypothetical protein